MTYHGADPNTFDSGAVAEHGHARRGETMRLKFRASMTFILFLIAGGAGAQFLQYTPPGGPERPPESRQEQLERELEAARYHLGPVRVAPWTTLRDVSYVRNFFSAGQEPPDDVTATLGAGLRAYLRNGRKITWTAQLLPEYVWWSRQPERRRLNGRYLLGVYGFFNRLTLEARAGREQQQRIVTPEVPVPVSSRSDGGEILAEVEVTRALFAFTAVSVQQQDHLVDELADPRERDLGRLGREERIARAGLRWRPRRQWSVALGAERSEVDFDRGSVDRSNSGTAPLAEATFEGRRLRFQAGVAARSLEARQGAAFVPYDKVTGNAALSLVAGNRLSWTVYTSRNLVYALSPAYAYLDDERLGTSTTVGLGRRLQTRLFVEGGSDDYTAFAPAAPGRRDDLFSYGASLTLEIGPGLAFGVQAVRSEFDSNLPGGDRSYTAVGTTVNLLGGR
ncbi:MAG TPA: hypothetical protein VGG03_00120 [Thermoanaerobaculia bacterium]|jgi:hypothetical protein